MPSRHETVKLRSKNRHALVTPLPRPDPPTLWQLDLINERLRRGDEPLALPPKVFAVLRYLHQRPSRLVTKQELLDAVWPDIAVTEAVLKNCILKLREVLGDDAKSPRYIETVHRRGYRLLTPLARSPQPVQSSTFKVSNSDTQDSALRTQHSVLVGRETELVQLHQWLEKALDGERQLIFITGEPGIGKTSLVAAFVARLANEHEHELLLSRGQCIEHYGAGEAYLPVLTALGQLCRAPGSEQLILLLSQHAPAWLVQMPALLTEEELATLQRKTAGVTKERMLREMAEALEVSTRERPLVLVLEDLHWSDPSTLDLLAFVARRLQPTRLLIIGTYRPGEMLAAEHPLRAVVQELQLHRQCEALPLSLLTEETIAEYLAARDGVGTHGQWKNQAEAVPRQSLARAIHHRTEGNPLFMVNVVDDLLARGELESANVEINAPTTISQMIERQFERLSVEDQQLVEIASVAGAEFSAAAVAAGSATAVEEVERRCTALARRGQLLHPTGVSAWPDETVASRYAFQHALYQEVLYDRVPAAQKVTWHRRIGERIETAYGKRAKEIALDLAVHFERGHDYQRTTRYLQHAAENALRKNAHQEAITLLTKGLELLKTLPTTPDHSLQELRLLRPLGLALIAIKGYAAPEVEQTYARAYELCQQDGSPRLLLEAMLGLQAFYFARGEIRRTREVAEQRLRLAQCVSMSMPTALIGAHAGLGEPLLSLGELTAARKHFEQAWGLYNPQEHNINVIQGWVDPGAVLLSLIAATLWSLGYPDQAQQRLNEGLALAEGLSHPFSLAFTLTYACSLHSVRQEWQRVREGAEEMIKLSTEQGFSYFLAYGTAMRGRALIEQGQMEEGIAQIEQSLAFFQATGTALAQLDHLTWLATAYAKVGRVNEGLAMLAEVQTLVDNTGARLHQGGLYVRKGWLLLARSREAQAEAEACFRQAIEIARHQQAKLLELRAVMSLSRLWQQQGKKTEAREMLAEIYNWFTEGFDTKDLEEAKNLLEELGQ